MLRAAYIDSLAISDIELCYDRRLGRQISPVCLCDVKSIHLVLREIHDAIIGSMLTWKLQSHGEILPSLENAIDGIFGDLRVSQNVEEANELYDRTMSEMFTEHVTPFFKERGNDIPQASRPPYFRPICQSAWQQTS